MLRVHIITQPNFLSSMFGNPSGPLEFLGFNAFRTRNTLNGVKLTSEHLLLIVTRRGKSGMLPSSNVNTEAKYLLKVLACRALSVIRFPELSLIDGTDFPVNIPVEFSQIIRLDKCIFTLSIIRLYGLDIFNRISLISLIGLFVFLFVC